ncbi:hypothetical protein [Streptomyces xiaopingdaonensis]|uniref:hypothetical protein n=1 Tax=Streptomyces xiaopingdaonensis TaxID=1565415 RepID=UPI0002FFA48E|nr:hypothetical protein [Streptomyces xiaopingdaonensis]
MSEIQTDSPREEHPPGKHRGPASVAEEREPSVPAQGQGRHRRPPQQPDASVA